MDHQTRTDGGYRLYTEQDSAPAAFYPLCKTIRFYTGSDHGTVIDPVDPEHHTCRESKQIVDDRLKDVETKLVEMQRMRDSLKMLSDACCGTAHVSSQSAPFWRSRTR